MTNNINRRDIEKHFFEKFLNLHSGLIPVGFANKWIIPQQLCDFQQELQENKLIITGLLI